MLELFYPNKYTASAYELPYERYSELGIRGLIFDIDNTLAPHDAPADERAVALFARFRELGLHTCLLSNNKEPRVASFAGKVGSPYIFKAGKPGRKNYEKAMELMGSDRKTTLFIGDQIFTDICGANRTGIYSILVKPINPREEFQIVAKRRLEAIVLWFYLRKCKKEECQNDRRKY